MRRATLVTFFVLAACGGTEAMKSAPKAVSERDLRAQFLMSADARAVIAELSKSVTQDALDTCLNAWVEDAGPGSAGPQEGPVSKPTVAGLRGFLFECLAGSIPGDLRAVDARATNPKGGTAEARTGSRPAALRISNAKF